jgi:hypothetical protein
LPTTATDLKSQVTNHRTVHVEHNGPVIIVRLQYQLATQHMNICEVPGLGIVFEISFLAQRDLGSNVQTPAKVCLALMHVYCTLVNLKGKKKRSSIKTIVFVPKSFSRRSRQTTTLTAVKLSTQSIHSV